MLFAKPNHREILMTQEGATSAEMQSPIRVLLVDDHRGVLWGLRKLIDGEAPRMSVVAEATCWQEVLNGLRHDPDVVLLDLDLGEESGLDMLPKLRERSRARVIILTGVRDTEMCDQAVVQGASGVVHKEEPVEVILKAISRVHGGELWLDAGTTGRAFAALSGKHTMRSRRAPAALLTDKQRLVVAAVVEHKGASAKVIAEAMHISPHTLRNHLASIYEKLGVHRRLDLVLYAMKNPTGKHEAGVTLAR